MKDDFSTLMPGHELVIERAKAVCSTVVTDQHGRLSIDLVDRLDELESALDLLDAGNHERAREVLEARVGPFPDFVQCPVCTGDGCPIPDCPHARNIRKGFEG